MTVEQRFYKNVYETILDIFIKVNEELLRISKTLGLDDVQKDELLERICMTKSNHTDKWVRELSKRLSAATPPDVDQKKDYWRERCLAAEKIFDTYSDDAKEEDIEKWISLTKIEAGQSAVQDATPQECQYCCDCDLKCSACEEGGYKCTAMFRRDVCPVCSLHSQLSAAQEENKKLQGYLYGPPPPPESGEQTKLSI